MRKLFLLFASVFSAVSTVSCVKHVNRLALDALAGIENKSFMRVEMTWEESTPILSVEADYGTADCDIMKQRESCAEYLSIVRLYDNVDMRVSPGRYVKDSDGYTGSIVINQPVCVYMISSDLSVKPSEILYDKQYYAAYSIFIPYTVTNRGEVLFDSFVPQVTGERYTCEQEHLACRIESFTSDEVVVTFPDYLLPDYSTDSFRTGKVKMVFHTISK